MTKSLFVNNGSTHTFNRVRPVKPTVVLIGVVWVSLGWYVSSPYYVEPHRVTYWLGGLFILFGAWMLTLMCNVTNVFALDIHDRRVSSTITTLYFTKISTQYSWDQFSSVRSVLIFRGQQPINRVELVAKDMRAALCVGSFPAVTKPGGSTLLAARKYENPLSALLRQEVSELMLLPDRGYTQDHYLKQLK